MSAEMSMDERLDVAEGCYQGQTRTPTGPLEPPNSRRQLLRQMASLSLGLPLRLGTAHAVFAQLAAQRQPNKGYRAPAPLPAPTALLPEDELFLDDLERSHFLYFWEQANPQTGLIKDRCNVRIEDTGV